MCNRKPNKELPYLRDSTCCLVVERRITQLFCAMCPLMALSVFVMPTL